MAPTTDIEVIELYIWNHFTALKNGVPLIAGRLHTYQANTTTPRAAYQDPWLTTVHANPIILDDQGSADIFLGAGFYHLRLEDPEGVQLWDILSFSFPSSAPPPAPGDKIMGSTETTPDVTPSPGTGVIAIPGLVPSGYRCEGIVWTVTDSFGTSNGLQEILIGDQIANDRWCRITNLNAGSTGGQVNFRSDVTPIEPIPYVILASAIGGNYDASGSLHITAFWSTLPADVP